MKDYSQHGEQLVIENYFGELVPNFLDCGCNDGITLSNVYSLIVRGAFGTMVEASPKAFSRLYAIHGHNPKLTLLNYAIGNENKDSVPFYESGDLLNTGDVGLVSSLKKEELKRWQTINSPDQKVIEFNEITVEMIDFQTMLYRSALRTFDLITIDVEAMELEILPQMNFDTLKTKMLIVEFNGKDRDKFDAIILPFEFKLLTENKANLIYAR